MKLIVKHYHKKDNHAGGMNQLLTALSTRERSHRERFWNGKCNFNLTLLWDGLW